MAFSYTPGSTADADRVRFEIGDTDIDRALFDDAEIADLIVQESTVLASAAKACEILSVRFARDFDFSADGASFNKAEVSKQYAKLGKQLRSKARSAADPIIPARRIDGYSTDINSTQVNGST